MNTTRELIEVHPFLAGLDPAARQQLAAVGHRIHFLAGSSIFAEGARADRFWLIQDGRVRLDLHLPGTGEVVIEDPVLGYQLMQRFMCVVVHRLQATRVRLLDLYRRP